MVNYYFSESFMEPFFGIYNRTILPTIQKQIAASNLKIADCFPKCKICIVQISNTSWYRNLNTQDQFAAYTSQQKATDP